MTDKQQYKYQVDEGLNKAYNNINNHFYDSENKVLYIAGTKSFDDVMTDMTIPLNMLEFTPRYTQAEQLYKLYEPNVIVGHSLSGLIAKKLNDKYGVAYRSYGAPIIGFGDKQYERRRHIGDPISIFDKKARIIGGVMDNPHSYKGYRNF